MASSVADIAFRGAVAPEIGDAEQAGKRRGSRDKGPVEILCDEIGFAFDKRLEREDVFVAFVREIVAEVGEMRWFSAQLAGLTASGPSEGSAEVLRLADEMLAADADTRRQLAEVVHDACDRLNPEDAYPTDHLIDMLSSCASAIRFGREKPCHSRHAASAADHVWKHKYGVRLSDGISPTWGKDWARRKLTSALISLLPSLAESR